MSLISAARVRRFAILSVLAVPLILASIGLRASEIERFIAIDNVCAWPNLTLFGDGTLVAAIFNKPSHGRHEGDVETWASVDGGKMWTLRGVAAPHESGTTRMNVAAGLAHDGSLVVLSSGWGGANLRGKILELWVCRSSDGGRTWQRSTSVRLPSGVEYLIPFGDVIRGPGNTLAAPFYYETRDWSNPPQRGARRYGTSYLLFSKDDGRTWGDAVVIGASDYNETSVLRLRPDRWLAAARTYADGHLDLFVSADEGKSWTRSGLLTLPSHHPAHLLRLADGRILLTYGIRERGHQGIGIRVSEDEGTTWKAPTRLVNLPETSDGGYPATVQLADGTLVTAYYSNGIPQHRRYHMGVVRWSPPD